MASTLEKIQNLLLEQILPFEELDPFKRGLEGGGQKLNTLEEQILSLKGWIPVKRGVWGHRKWQSCFPRK